MKRLKLWLAATLLTGASLALADPPAQVGRLNFLQGTVSFAPAEANTDWAVAPLNRPITTGDRLWADRDGRAEFRIGPNAMRIATMTSLDVLRLDDDVTHLRLAQGTLLVRLRRLDSGDSFEISTPNGAVLLTRPGLYRVTVDGSGMPTTVLVREGQADVLTGNAPLSVNTNQLVTLSAADPAFGAAPGADEFERWAYARDNPPQPVAATRYVHPDMTGHEDLDQHGTWQAEPQYGNVWIPAAASLPVGWAPYRYGRWVWVSPWGWTWVDNAPWGFAPYHYGRWVWLGHRWAWAPGPRAPRPVYAPALVAFVGGHNWSVSVASGPAVAWVPLGWREPYIPWYRHSPRYVRNVNVTHVTNLNVINQYTNVNNVTRIRYVNRDVPTATTVVTRDTFVRARHVHEARLDVPVRTLAAAQVTHATPVVRPERQSLVATQPGVRLPATVATREVIAAREPAAPARLIAEGAARNDKRANDAEDRPRVRVLQTKADAQKSRAEAAAGDKRPDAAPVLGIAPKGAPGNERTADPAAEKAQARGDTKAGDDARKRPLVAMPPGDRERAEQKALLRADTKAGDDLSKKPPAAMPQAERERTKAALDTKTGDAPQKPTVAMPPGERERAAERAAERQRAAPDAKLEPKTNAKAAGEMPRPPLATLAPADAQRLQQQQQERHAREEQERQARAQQEKQAQEQKQQQERAAAAQQQQDRSAQQNQLQQQEQQRLLQQQQERQAREEQQRQARTQQEKQAQEQKQQQERAAAAQQQQARAAQQKQLQEQQEQQRLLQQQQQQQRALQQQAAQQQQERQAREEQQRQLQQQRVLQQQQAAQQQQERQAREEQQRQRALQQQAAQQQREQQAQLAQQAQQQRAAERERQQRRAPDNPEQPQARRPKPPPEQVQGQGR